MLPFCESKGSVLAVWPHMHRRELHNQGWCSTRRCCWGHCFGCPRHFPK